MTTPLAVSAIVTSYLLGSVSFAMLAAKLVKGVDLRSVGSGNLGATNAGRVLGRTWGLGIYLLDLLKGFVPTWVAMNMLDGWQASAARYLPLPMLMGAAAFLGHCFPFYLRFRGGKGVATASGVILAVSPAAFIASVVGFAVSVAAFRMVSLGSMVAAVVLPVAYLSAERRHALQLPQLAWLTFFLAITILVIVRHRSNIHRIVEGTESKIGRNGS